MKRRVNGEVVMGDGSVRWWRCCCGVEATREGEASEGVIYSGPVQSYRHMANMQ